MACQRSLILSIIPLLICTTFGQDWDFIIRATKYGDVRGYAVPMPPGSSGSSGSSGRVSEGGLMQLDVFAGIPYARPPVGERRWTPTEEPEPWTGAVYNAIDFSPCCPQNLNSIRVFSFGPNYNNTHEDCLYLNVYAPRNTSNPDLLFPVMVWIHGGAYRYGSGEEYDGQILARQGVVVVTVNYRLGVLGFLSTDDEEAAGNYGMMDVLQSLRWVRENIANFGGDRERVTLFGQSAGGAAVSLLMFSDYSQGLVHRVIPHSGDVMSTWGIYRPPLSQRPITEELAQKAGCPTTSSKDMLACLRTKDALDLVHTSVSSPPGIAAWVPRVDGDLVKGPPEDLLAEGQFLHVPLLTGTVPDEVTDEYQNVEDIEIGWSRDEKESRMYSRSRRYGAHAELMHATFKHEYNHPGDDYARNRDLYFELRNDDEYIAPHHRHVMGHSAYAPDTFLYSFEYRTANHPKPAWMGVPHSEELYYLLGTPFWNNNPCPWTCRNILWYNRQHWTADDELMSVRIMEVWKNFAYSGNPSSPGVVDWPRFTPSNEHYVTIGDDWESKNYYKYRRTHFWNVYKFQLLNTTVECDVTPELTTTPSLSSAPHHVPYHVAWILFFVIRIW